MKINAKYDTHPVYIELAKMFSSVKIMGPPMSEKLVALISHIFSLEEACICRHLSFIYPKTIEKIARKSGCPPGVITPMLKEMSRKRIIITIANRYMLYPLIPGTFEHILRTGEDDAWHNKYAELINELINSGYLREYFSRPINAIRNIPVQQAVDSKNIIADTDLISEMIDSHKNFAVFHTCPCRHSMHLTGHACSRASPQDGCLTFGDYSLGIASEGNGRSVSKKEMYDIVAERRDKNLVFFTSNVLPSSPTAICTCCDCCCRALKIHNSFSKNLVTPSHLIAEIDESLCNNCGRCIKACNTHAHYFDNKKHVYNHDNCIGCGNCIIPCRKKAIKMIENRLYKPPLKSYTRLILNMLPPVILTGVKIKLRRYFSRS
ncbi:MAG: hypothetical protein A2176_09525 [Spirochaetes bacterium RBG_13_51_14]|nr:MAG: hypothetical protein A2176_09525 [Spirochaetes bacterium RBG_13_51_14]